MDRIGFGIVGCGRVSPKHLQAIAATPSARLVAVCDVERSRAEAAAAPWGVPAYTDLSEMLAAQPGIEVVDVLTPSGDHAASAIVALRAGRHVLVEKPMALALDDAEAMVVEADRARRRLFVVKQNRFNRPIVALRERFEAGDFGRLVIGTVRVRWCRTQDYYDQDPWRGTWRWDGGVLSNQASHHVDLLQWFLGEPEEVYAVGRTALVDIEAEDTAAAVIQFRGGAIGIVEATTATRPRDLEGSFSLLGERGSVVVGGFAVNRVDQWQFEGDAPDASARMALSEQPPDVYGFGHRAVIANVCEALRRDEPALVDGLEGMKSLRLTVALYESIATGRPVPLRAAPPTVRLGRP